VLLPWSKSLTLSIAKESIALRDLNGKVHLLSMQTTDFASIANVLKEYQTLFKHQSVEVILSHQFVRFLALPWQAHVFQLKDWQAIAQHAFKKEFGVTANDWQVAVHLYGFGQPILATAMDKSAIHYFNEISRQLDCRIKSISPLLNKCCVHQLSEKDWLLIVEPQRLLLLKMQMGFCHHVWVDVPPTSCEQQHATQLIQRALMQVPKNEYPAHVLTYVSTEIQADWKNNNNAMIKLIKPVMNHQAHAAWMATLASSR